MRPITISPCTECGLTLEHDHDPRTVLCAGCERDKFLRNRHLVPPPSTEWRGKRKTPPPEPPPMRHTYQAPTWLEPGYRVLSIAAMLALGFLMGWIARGGQ